MSPNHFLVTMCICRETRESFGFGLSNTLRGNKEGCYIKAIGKQSPADRAGLKKYDRLIKVR